MWTDLVAVVGLALLAGAWVLVQQWVGRQDPQQPGVEGSRCGRHCTGACERDGVCEREAGFGVGEAAVSPAESSDRGILRFPVKDRRRSTP